MEELKDKHHITSQERKTSLPFGKGLRVGLDLDKWQEIGNNLWHNLLRTVIVSLLMSWGIFMFMVLLGMGKGIQNGVENQFAGFARNAMWVWTWKTSRPYNGLPPGRRISLNNDDFLQVKHKVKGVEYITPRLGYWGVTVNHKGKNGTYDLMGVHQDFMNIGQLIITQGRFINNRDVSEKRKVITIGNTIAETLFQGKPCIGEYLNLKGAFFQIVGVFRSTAIGEEAKEDEESLYAPYTAFQQTYNVGDRIGNLILTIDPSYESEDVENAMKKIVASNHIIHPDDETAIGSWSSAEDYKMFSGLFIGINIFFFVVAIGTILTGVIANAVIMLITVKDRTKEIGVRKALGATPYQIISLIMQEAMAITIFSGIMGLFAGIFLIETIGTLFINLGIENDYFGNPEIDVWVAIAGLFVLILSGLISGLIPAYRASKIKPIEALRTE